MKVTFLTLYVSRRGGGLFDCMRRLGQELIRREKIAVEALGIEDSDFGNDTAAWPPVQAHVFPSRNFAGFRFAPGMRRGLQADVVHTHGLWSFASVTANMWRKRTGGPTVISSHGMLDPWALRQSAWKKWLVGTLFERQHLRSAACLHALCATEAEAFRTFGLRNPVCIIPNGVDLPPAPGDTAPDAPWRVPVAPDQRVLLYLGRLHPKKGLLSLLRAWAALWRQDAAAGEWTLVIAGWDQGGHAAKLAALVAELGIGGAVHFAGPLFGADKAAAYRHADAFVLPSLSEGLPLVVLEAWSHRLPVVMTAACNLPEGFAAGAALESGPSPEELTQTLARLVGIPEWERRQMGERGRALVENQFTWNSAAARMAQVYRWVAGQGNRPEFVFD